MVKINYVITVYHLVSKVPIKNNCLWKCGEPFLLYLPKYTIIIDQRLLLVKSIEFV